MAAAFLTRLVPTFTNHIRRTPSLSPLRPSSISNQSLSSSTMSSPDTNTRLTQQQSQNITMRYGLLTFTLCLIGVYSFYAPSMKFVSGGILSLSSTHTKSDSSTDSKYVSAFCTVPNEQVADKITEEIVSSRLVACVNRIPGVKSSYWWEGKVEHEQELLLMMKTKRDLVHELNEKIKQLHPYDVHELIVQPIIAGNIPYLNWIDESTKNKS